MVITVTLNPALDLSLLVPDWAEGEVNRAVEANKYVGGKGINISRVLHELGEPTTALTVVGGESIVQFQRLARSVGCQIVYINIPGEIRTNIHLTDPVDGRSLKVNQSGPKLDDVHFNHFKLLFRQHLRTARMVGIGGSLPPGRSSDTYRDLIALANEFNVPCLVDTVGPALLAALEEKPLVVKPNRQELEETLGVELASREDVIDAARQLQARGSQYVVVTDGPNPVVGVYGKEAWVATPPKVETAGTTGAGDALAAGLISGLSTNKPFDEALGFAVAVSAAACLTPEGQLVRRDDVVRLERMVKVVKT